MEHMCDKHLELEKGAVAMRERMNGYDDCIERIENMMTELFNSRNAHTETLHKIDLCVTRTSGEIASIKAAIKERSDKGDAIISWAHDKCKEYDAKLMELDEFQWFRKWMNDIRNDLPKFILYGIGTVLGILMLMHWSGIGDAIKKWLTK